MKGHLKLWTFRILRVLRRIVMAPVAFVLAAAMVITQQWHGVRLVPLNVSRIGHLGVDAAYAIAETSDYNSVSLRRRSLVFVPNRIDLSVANRELWRQWRTHLYWLPAWVGEPVIWFLWRLPRGRSCVYLPPKEIGGRFHWGADPRGHISSRPICLQIDDAQVSEAQQALSDMGLDLSKPTVCLHVRDDRYHMIHSGGVWRESHSWRNLGIETFCRAAEELASRGFQIVRLGVHTSQKFSAADETRIFDYANNGYRTELLDIYLVSICRFMMSTSSGIDSLTQTFQKPLYNVGVIAPSQLYIHRHLFSIIQRFEHAESGRKLTLRESFALPKINDQSLVTQGLRAIPNPSEEIAEFAIEAAERDLGTWRPSPEDIELQQRFLALLPREFRQFPIRGGIGAAFLRRNRDWLE